MMWSPNQGKHSGRRGAMSTPEQNLTRRELGHQALEAMARSHPDASSQVVDTLQGMGLSYRRQDMLADWRMATGREARGIVSDQVRQYERSQTEHRTYRVPVNENGVISQGQVNAVQYYNRRAESMYIRYEVVDKDGKKGYIQTKSVEAGDFDIPLVLARRLIGHRD